MGAEYRCKELKRADAVRGRADLNGIDFLEVLDRDAPSEDLRQRILVVTFLNPLTATISEENIRIEGGERVRDIGVTDVQPGSGSEAHILRVTLDKPGDFSWYTLRLVSGPASDPPPGGFDPVLSAVEFSFKVECPGDFDCKPRQAPPPEKYPEPVIDYLAKDYAGFRRLMLDRLSVTVPEWKERNPADVGVALVEVLAYAADQLSYYQDAAATEAYLGTARRRVSVRRHARLLDYRLHEGVNARAWVQIHVDADDVPLPEGTQLFTRMEGFPGRIPPNTELHDKALASGAEVFETLHAVKLFAGHKSMRFHTWGNERCVLPKGATRAVLSNKDGSIHLKAADVLILQDAADCHPVRLTMAKAGTDPVGNTGVVEIEWTDGDALPHDLDTARTVVLGNIVPADHGRTVTGGTLENVTFATPYDAKQPASAALVQDPRDALPDMELQPGDWNPKIDLLASGRFDQHFVLEIENDRSARIRFGDGIHGRHPSAELTATWRTGNGAAGNVGAKAIGHVVSPDSGVLSACNPMPAQGGIEPETLQQVRLYAPQAFRTQERAVVESDYAAMAQRHPEVQKAAATLRWTGSWHTVFITVDRRGGRRVDMDFENRLRVFLERFRLAGYDVEIEPPQFVSLEIVLKVCVQPGYFQGAVKQALFEKFRELFDPDQWTFGQTVYLSPLIAAAMSVPGVLWVEPLVFERQGEGDRGELAAGRMTLGRLEIARLGNDPNRPESGTVDFEMEGGL